MSGPTFSTRTGKPIVPVPYVASLVPATVLLVSISSAVGWLYFLGLLLVGLSMPIAIAVVAVPGLLIVGVVPGIRSKALLRFERLQRPTVPDHLRRCALLYAFAALLGPLLVAFYGSDWGGGYAATTFVVCVLSVCAFFVDALILFVERRCVRSDLGGAR